MSSFTTPLIVEHQTGANLFGEEWKHWKLTEPFEYHVGEYPSDEVILVPAGFETDFASIPRVFWSILPPTGRYGKAAVIHDYLYSHKVIGKLGYTRKDCDRIFLEGMEVLRVAKWKRTVMYRWVRTFGWYIWKVRIKENRMLG